MSTRPVETFSIETCCFSGHAEKTTGPELRVCAGIGALVANTQSEPSAASSQRVNLSFLTQKGWGSLTPHPSLLPSLQFDDILTVFLLERFRIHKQKWPRLTDKETDQEETVLLFNTVVNWKVINTNFILFPTFQINLGDTLKSDYFLGTTVRCQGTKPLHTNQENFHHGAVA